MLLFALLQFVCITPARCGARQAPLPLSKLPPLRASAGAGVGKGRQIAALIKQHWAEGGRRALWVSVSADLRYDAARDLQDVKATHIPVCPKVGAGTNC